MSDNHPDESVKQNQPLGILFNSDMPESTRLDMSKLVRLRPFGVSLVPDPNRPILILKDETNQHTLPVSINPLEAGVMLTQFNRLAAGSSPHRVTELLLQSLDIRIEKCIFIEIKGHFQYVRLFLVNHPHLKSIKIRAEEAMSLCLHLNIDIFATPEFMLASREQSLRGALQINDQALAKSNGGGSSGYLQ